MLRGDHVVRPRLGTTLTPEGTLRVGPEPGHRRGHCLFSPKWPRASPEAPLCDPGCWASSPCCPVRLQDLPASRPPFRGPDTRSGSSRWWMGLPWHWKGRLGLQSGHALGGLAHCPQEPPRNPGNEGELRQDPQGRAPRLCLAAGPGPPDPAAQERGCSQGGQWAPRWEQTPQVPSTPTLSSVPLLR